MGGLAASEVSAFAAAAEEVVNSGVAQYVLAPEANRDTLSQVRQAVFMRLDDNPDVRAIHVAQADGGIYYLERTDTGYSERWSASAAGSTMLTRFTADA